MASEHGETYRMHARDSIQTAKFMMLENMAVDRCKVPLKKADKTSPRNITRVNPYEHPDLETLKN